MARIAKSKTKAAPARAKTLKKTTKTKARKAAAKR